MIYRHAQIIYINNQGLTKSANLKVWIADSFFSRLRGLMGSASLPSSEALLLSPCNSIHTCFMKYSIDVLFLDKDYHCIKNLKNIQPWRFGIGERNSKYTLELSSNNLLNEAVKVEKIEFLNTHQNK